MYQDVSVTVSSAVVRDFDRCFSALDVICSFDEAELTQEERFAIADGLALIKKLFLWSEDLLGERCEFEILLTRKLKWYDEILSVIEIIGEDPIEYINELVGFFHDLLGDKTLDPEDVESLAEFCFMASGTIWDHFIEIHANANPQ